MLRLPNDWVWDSWIADDGDRFHLYFLQEPQGILSFEIIDPVTVAVVGDGLQAV